MGWENSKERKKKRKGVNAVESGLKTTPNRITMLNETYSRHWACRRSAALCGAVGVGVGYTSNPSHVFVLSRACFSYPQVCKSPSNGAQTNTKPKTSGISAHDVSTSLSMSVLAVLSHDVALKTKKQIDFLRKKYMNQNQIG